MGGESKGEMEERDIRNSRPIEFTGHRPVLVQWLARRLARRLRVGESFDGVGFAAPVEGGAPGYGVSASASASGAVVVVELDAVFTAGDGAPGVVLDFVRTGGDRVVLLAGLGGDGAAEGEGWGG